MRRLRTAKMRKAPAHEVFAHLSGCPADGEEMAHFQFCYAFSVAPSQADIFRRLRVEDGLVKGLLRDGRPGGVLGQKRVRSASCSFPAIR